MGSIFQARFDILQGDKALWLAAGESCRTSGQRPNPTQFSQVTTELQRIEAAFQLLSKDMAASGCFHALQVAAVAGVATGTGSAVAPVLLPSVGRVGQAVRNGAAANVSFLAAELLKMDKYPADDCNDTASNLLSDLKDNEFIINEIKKLDDEKLRELQAKCPLTFRYLPRRIVFKNGAVDLKKLKILWQYGCRRQFFELGKCKLYVSALGSLAATDLFLRDGTDEDQKGISSPKVCEVLLRAACKAKEDQFDEPSAEAIRFTLESMKPSAVFQIAVAERDKAASAKPGELFSALEGSWFAKAFGFDANCDDPKTISDACTNFFDDYNKTAKIKLDAGITGYMLNVADSEDVIIQRIYKSHRPSQMAVSNTKLLKLDDMGLMRMQFAVARMPFTQKRFDDLCAIFAKAS
jgi:hypothetical protein